MLFSTWFSPFWWASGERWASVCARSAVVAAVGALLKMAVGACLRNSNFIPLNLVQMRKPQIFARSPALPSKAGSILLLFSLAETH